jgi:two-component system, sensor histidine kinase and response regulator
MDSQVFDRQSALARMGGDEGLLRDMAEFFFADVGRLFDTMREGLSAKKPTDVERAAHTLKGLASNFGATRAIRSAWTVESLAHTGDLESAHKGLGEMEQAFAELRATLQSSLNLPVSESAGR